MKNSIVVLKNYWKDRLTHDEAQELITYIIRLSLAANFAELNVVLAALQSALTKFRATVHPIEKSDLTNDVRAFNKVRNKYVAGVYHYVQFGLRHYDPAMVAAAEKIDVVLHDPAYNHLRQNSYDRASGKIKSLLKELNTNCADAVATLNLSAYLQQLESANQAFCDTYNARNMSKANNSTWKEIREARTAMENAFDLYRKQLSLLAELNPSNTSAVGTGGTTGGGGASGTEASAENIPVAQTYAELITYINDRIDRITAAAKHRQTMGRKAKKKDGATTPVNEEE